MHRMGWFVFCLDWLCLCFLTGVAFVLCASLYKKKRILLETTSLQAKNKQKTDTCFKIVTMPPHWMEGRRIEGSLFFIRKKGFCN